jgi:hypothetical protein
MYVEPDFETSRQPETVAMMGDVGTAQLGCIFFIEEVKLRSLEPSAQLRCTLGTSKKNNSKM